MGLYLCCLHHRRLWEETHDGKYPYSKHAPTCKNYKTERFVVVSYDGSSCVMEPTEAEAMKNDDPDHEYSFSEIELTRDQFERMEDFAGW